MSSEGADMRKFEENLTFIESLVFHHHGDSYRSFIRDSPISDPLERIVEFIKLEFGLSSEAEYIRFTAEARTEPDRPEFSQIAQNDAEDLNLPSNGGQEPDFEMMLTEDEIKIEICPEPIDYGNEMVEIQHQPIDIKQEVISIEDGPEVTGRLPKSGLLSCGQCRTRSGDFGTMEELEKHIFEKHGRGQSQVVLLKEPIQQCTTMEPLPTPHPPTICEGMKTNNSDDFFSNDDSNIEVQGSAGSIRSPQASAPPSEPCTQPHTHESHFKVPPVDDLVKLDLPKVDYEVESTSNPQEKSNGNPPPQDLPINNPNQPTAPNGQGPIHPQPPTSTGPPFSSPISCPAKNPDEGGLSRPESKSSNRKRPKKKAKSLSKEVKLPKEADSHINGGPEALETVSHNDLNACNSASPIDSDFVQSPNLAEASTSVKRKPGRPKKNPLETPTPEDASKTAKDAGDPPQLDPQPPTDVQAPVPKRRGRPPSKKKPLEQPQTSKSSIIENKEVERPLKVPTPLSQDIIHRIVESTKGLTVFLGPRLVVKLKTPEPESIQIDQVIDSTTKTMSHAHFESPSSDLIRKKRAREGEEETPRKTSKVGKSSTSSSNDVKGKLDKGNRKPGGSTSKDSGSKTFSSDANCRRKKSFRGIKDKPAGIPQNTKRGGAQKPIFRTRIFNYELGSFNAGVFHCSHNPGELEAPLFPITPVPFVGQIKPEIVWDYIDKMKKSEFSIEIIVFRLKPASVADREGYITFFKYLSSNSSLGVLGGVSDPIKYVYLLPLDKNTPIPRALLPFHGPGLRKDRNHSLLAIVIRHTPEPLLPQIPDGVKRRISSGVEASALKMRPEFGGFEIKPGDVQTALSGTSGSISGQGKKESPPSDDDKLL